MKAFREDPNVTFRIIPPLSQSRHGDMACETLYVRKHVDGAKVSESEPAARGIEVHQPLSTYANHLVRTRRATDLEVFDALMRGVGIEARAVLDKFRTTMPLTRRRSLQQNSTLHSTKTSFRSSRRVMTRHSRPMREPST